MAVVGLIAVLLVVLGIAIDLVFGARLTEDLEDDLADRVNQVPGLLQAGLGPQELVDALQGPGLRVQVLAPNGRIHGDARLEPVLQQPDQISQPTSDGDGDAWPQPPWEELPNLTVTRMLPDGSLLTIEADSDVISEERSTLRREMLVGAIGTLALAALAVHVVAGRALSPLQDLSATAEGITRGDRGRRIHPDRPQTELGCAAKAFDRMLDALESAEQRANDSAIAARRAELHSRQFLSDAAHELRTPLAGIQVVADQLIASTQGHADTVEAAEVQRTRMARHAALLANETQKTSRLLNDLLDIARIDAGLSLRLQRTDLAPIVAAEVDRAAMLAPTLDFERSGAQQLFVEADPTRIAQILSNLLDNSRRHTPPSGRITVFLEDSDDTAQITVTDTGPGVPDADRDRVFDRLVRLEDARDSDSGGSGLGLPIARALARAHHGSLVCLPRQRGAAFRLSLPKGQTSAPGDGPNTPRDS